MFCPIRPQRSTPAVNPNGEPCRGPRARGIPESELRCPSLVGNSSRRPTGTRFTGEDGKAHVSFHAPMALSEYQFTARGVTGADTLAGQTTADLTVRKPFFVDWKRPPSLTQGDKPRFSARLHHAGLTGKADIRLTLYAGGREVVQPRTIAIQGDGVDEVAFDPFEVPDGDVVRLTLAARLGEASDELVAEVPIRPWGCGRSPRPRGRPATTRRSLSACRPDASTTSLEMLIVVSPTVQRMLIEPGPTSDSRPRRRTSLRFCWRPPGPSGCRPTRST
ncbi:MAG: alpha-2-macroglobulin family protein [Singulisphaera sp.]